MIFRNFKDYDKLIRYLHNSLQQLKEDGAQHINVHRRKDGYFLTTHTDNSLRYGKEIADYDGGDHE